MDLQQSCTRHCEGGTSFKLPNQLKIIPSAVHSVMCVIFLKPFKRYHFTSLFSSFIDHSRVQIFFLKFNIIYLLIIPSPPHQDTLNLIKLLSPYIISAYFYIFPFPPPPHSRLQNISSADLSSVQVLSPIIPHQKSKVNVFIRFYIYVLFRHPHIRITYNILIIITSHHNCLFLFISFPPSPTIDSKTVHHPT